jgi:hypothetical protein
VNFIYFSFIVCVPKIISECPKPELLKPCDCDNEVILCGGNQYYNLKHLFESLILWLIYFDSASNLTTINTHTFTATNLVTKRFETQNTPIANPLPDSDILKTSFYDQYWIYKAGYNQNHWNAFICFQTSNGISKKFDFIPSNVFRFRKESKTLFFS